jgi:uncharacterized delta-60 repeat protein
VIQQVDGKLVVAGYSWNGSNYDFALVRYNADGSLDTGFDGDGKVTTDIGASNDVCYSVIQQADGKLVVAGIATTAAIMILRWCATTPMAPWIPALMGMASHHGDWCGQ